MYGRVLWFDSIRGYGFIKNEDGREFFFHHTQLQMEGYKYIYSGTPVSFDLSADSEGKEMVKNICARNRITCKGKPIILVAYTIVRENSNLTRFNFDIARKAESGISYLKVIEDTILCTDKALSEIETITIKNIIKEYEPKINVPMQTDMEYDLLFI